MGNLCSLRTHLPAKDQTMNAVALIDPVLMRFRGALDDMYGDRLVRVMLFGSRARGDGRCRGLYIRES
jgi:hypothetical protein